MLRRIFGFAHNIDFDWIQKDAVRGLCEHNCAKLGIEMITNPSQFINISSLLDKAIEFDNLAKID